MLQLSHESYKLLVTGKSGKGKSSYWLRVLAGRRADYRFIFDHKGEVSQRLGLPAASTIAELADGLAGRWCLFNPSRMFPGRLPTGFLFFCDWVFEMCGTLPGTKLFACDELQHLAGTSKLPIELAKIVEDGRLRGIDCAFIASQANTVHNRIRNQITECVSFMQEDEHALGWLREYGFDPEAVKRLQKWHFIARREGSKSQISGKVAYK